nr:hypothetical protein [Tanacetum cinerariifolium]
MIDFHSCMQEEGQSVSSIEKTVNELHAMLKLHEQTLPKNNAPALHAIRAGKVQKGHWKRNYPQYLAELLKKKKNAASGAGGSGIFVIEFCTILNRSWIYDTGCGTHIFNTTQGIKASRKLKPGALSLYVGNGQREAVEAIDVFNLCLLSRLEIVLNNCRYATSITRGVISVSCLYEDGFVNRFVNNTIYVSRNNMVYFSAIPRDGIFEIDLSNSYTNESFIYVVSNKRAKLDLDSALLSGNMARKPYTHQVERAKDLFGLIHIDVCGPFKIMSRQGASYFVTFTDDFSRYPKETMGYSFYYPPVNKVLIARNAEFIENNLINQEANGSLEDLEIIQEEDTHPSIDTSLNHDEDDLDIDKPQSDIVPIRRSTRTRHASDRMCLYIDAEEHELEDLSEPANYKAALLDPEIDYEKTFSPVADISAIRILIAIALYYDYEIWKMDVNISFLNGYLNEKVYMEQPEGFVNQKYSNRVCKLKRSIYRLKQASSAYIEKIFKRYCMENSKRGTIPIQEKLNLSKSQGDSTPAELKRMQNVLYASAIGSIMYAVRCTRPDVVFAQNVTSRFQQNPEAEYITAFDASKEAVWVRKFIYGLGVVPTIEEPISMYYDNTRAIVIANESRITKGARHFCAKVHYLREVIEY